ncbi:heterokaryon incompatibility protein s [Xylariaceae sp. FL0255]|nr:heterokaryon incompatibility protein s [Xylariaceae sp. FL0255]
MAETFGVVTGRHFARDYEICQLRLDVALARLTRWGQAVNINHDARFALNESRDNSVFEARKILEGIHLLLQSLRSASKRYEKRNKIENCEHLAIEDPSSLRLHDRLVSIIDKRQKGTGIFRKAAWALHDRNSFNHLVTGIKDLISDLEGLFPASESVRQELVEIEIEEIGDEPSLSTLQDAATGMDDVLATTAGKKVKALQGRNYAKNIASESNAHVRVGDEVSEAALASHLISSLGHTTNEADSVMAKGNSAVDIGNSYGGRSIFDRRA